MRLLVLVHKDSETEAVRGVYDILDFFNYAESIKRHSRRAGSSNIFIYELNVKK